MAGIRDRTAVYALKKGLFDLASELWATSNPEFVQSWGPLANRPDEFAQWLDGSSEQAAAALGTNRSRDEDVTVAVEMYCIRRGEVDTAREAEEYVFDRLGELERHIRMDHPTVGGVALWCFMSRVANDTVDARPRYDGHLAGVRAEFTARIRITG